MVVIPTSLIGKYSYHDQWPPKLFYICSFEVGSHYVLLSSIAGWRAKGVMMKPTIAAARIPTPLIREVQIPLIIIYYYLSIKTDVESLQVHVMVMPFLPFWDLKTKNIDFVGREQWPEWHWLSASVGFEVHHLAVLLSGPSSTWNIKLCKNSVTFLKKLHFWNFVIAL